MKFVIKVIVVVVVLGFVGEYFERREAERNEEN